MIKLFVGGFPMDITELELVILFSPHCEVSTIKIVRDKKTGNCKGYAFLEVTNKEGADRAMDALDGTSIGDRELSVKITEDKPTPAPKTFSKFGGNKFSAKPSYQKPSFQKPVRAEEPEKKKRPRKQF